MWRAAFKRFFLLPCLYFISHCPLQDSWLLRKQRGYTFLYKKTDRSNLHEYDKLIKEGMKTATGFFDGEYKQEFLIVIHPDRHSLDSSWAKDWAMPSFRSECWMVASGVADQLDMISPKLWDKEACEHHYKDTEKTRQLITHELIHVYHGQLNASRDFSNTDRVDWFVEGLATYASGQFDENKSLQVKEAIREGKVPKSLDQFWEGKYRYAFSGSIVKYIDNKFGRTVLKELLPLNRKQDVLSHLKTTEPQLLQDWEDYCRNQSR